MNTQIRAGGWSQLPQHESYQEIVLSVPFLLSVDPSAAANSAGGSVRIKRTMRIKPPRTGGLLPLRYAFLHSTRGRCGTENQAGQIASSNPFTATW